ncbi:hypothetical protein SAMN05421848_1705 [Kushneria avicenniae]|uniref:Uncharacterized protein n=1 Tax=Kushneria avicenniae TaxID=402385 RepID=A0A1I1JQY9_9GAMM|nr:hypothetical protein [Kushneria avicenniae]SFC50815.1 hypothetical protein SAMN05421848_1705 [Kushneria avicenniae]
MSLMASPSLSMLFKATACVATLFTRQRVPLHESCSFTFAMVIALAGCTSEALDRADDGLVFQTGSH